MTTLNSLTSMAWLMYVSVHCPRLNFKVRGGEVSVDGLKLNTKQVTAPRWKLMPDELKQKLTEIQNQVSATLDRYKTPVRSAPLRRLTADTTNAYGNVVQDNEEQESQQVTYLRGLHLIPYTKVGACVAELRRLDTELRTVVQDFAADMETFRDKIREQMGDEAAWEHARTLIPSTGELLAKTGIEWVPFPMGSQDVENENRDEIHQLIQQRMSAFIDGMIESIIEEPRKELFEALENLDTLIQEDRRVTMRSLNPVIRAIEKLQAFGISDTELSQRIDHLQSRLNVVTPSEQNRTTAASNGLTAAIRNVMDQARDEASIVAEYGRAHRGIEFADMPQFE